MNKLYLLVVFLLLTTVLFSQKIFITQQIGTISMSQITLEYKESLRSKRTNYAIRYQYTYGTDFTNNYINVKAGFGIDVKDVGFYTYLPYFNFMIGEGYNTPFSFEIFYRENMSLCLDMYSNKPSVLIKGRFPIINFDKPKYVNAGTKIYIHPN